jgi:hypothetical protein
MLRRALAAAAPVTMAGVLQLTLGATSASAAVAGGAHAQHPAPLAGLSVTGLLRLLEPAHLLAPRVAAPAVHASNAAPAPTTPAARASSRARARRLLDSCVSCTGASAVPGHATAGATGLRVLGNDLSAGASDGDGAHSGSLLTLPSNPLLDMALAGWATSTQTSQGSTSGDAHSALTDLSILGGQVARLSLLPATSHAAATGASSSGSAATDGVDVSLAGGALNLVLLHSDTAGDGSGHLYLASVNGTSVAADSLSGAIPVTVPGILDLGLLQIQAANGSGSADVGTVSGLLGDPGTAADVLGSSSSGGAHGAPPSASGPEIFHSPVGVGSPDLTLMPNPHAVPNTGTVLGTAGLGLVLAGIGLATASALRRRRRTAVA